MSHLHSYFSSMHSPTIPGALQPEPVAVGDLQSTLTPSGSDATSTSSDSDPLLLASRLQTEEHINSLRRRRKHRKAGKVVGEFYEKQNKQIESLLMTMDQHIESAQEEEDTNRLAIKIAIYGSLAANCVLAILQIYAAAASLSLSFFATAMDAVFDPLANITLNYCHRMALRADPRRYPSGGSRLETIGDIVYAGAMGSVSVVLIAFSIQDLVKGRTGDSVLHISSVVVVGIAFVTKFALFIYCYSVRSKNSQVRVLWEDHRNDLFVNGFGILTSSAGAKLRWWIDPVGALIISLALIIVWGRTLRRQFLLLAGVAAPLEFQQLVLYKAMMFADSIKQIDSCSVYHAGPDYVVEIDIVMEADTPLWKAHDVSQALQDKIEQMPNVGRAFVHVDHETSHKPEHRKMK
ncbi:cation efflux family-domain-containing protein [Mycena belliarum]|uniref:Cation efflux family-domain-containing protein n=1 Tax=Mycena belliarum TaxID=1033014 RepID=A0AAD6XHJ0_9AGAR|nr:cation efflux family-domain-containing protein [Mycena belliae]